MLVRLRRSWSAAVARSLLVLGVTLNDIPTVFSASMLQCIALRNRCYNVKHNNVGISRPDWAIAALITLLLIRARSDKSGEHDRSASHRN